MLPHDDYPIDNSNIHPPISPSQNREEGRIMSFADVEARLVEAVRTSWRLPDREAGWLHLRSAWPEIRRDMRDGDYDARGGDGSSSDVALRALPLTRRDVAAMDEAFGWVLAVAAEDRRLVGLALRALARGARRVPWLALRRQMGVRYGADGLRMRYGRAMREICRRANQGLARAAVCQEGGSCETQI